MISLHGSPTLVLDLGAIQRPQTIATASGAATTSIQRSAPCGSVQPRRQRGELEEEPKRVVRRPQGLDRLELLERLAAAAAVA